LSHGGIFQSYPELALLDECLKREKLPSEALTMYLKVVPMTMTRREDNGIGQFHVTDITGFANLSGKQLIFSFRLFNDSEVLSNKEILFNYQKS